jgi:hypothetical protein
VNSGGVGDEGEESLEDLELYFDILRNAVVQCLGDGRDLRKGDCARGDGALERADSAEAIAFFARRLEAPPKDSRSLRTRIADPCNSSLHRVNSLPAHTKVYRIA